MFNTLFPADGDAEFTLPSREWLRGSWSIFAGEWRLNGVQLKPYQKYGLEWMMQREKPSNKPRGGILAIEMGLGKTIQAIALSCAMRVVNRALRSLGRGAETLIVAPLAIMRQWEEEFRTKTQPEFRVLRYHGADSEKVDLKECDVVITSEYCVFISKTTVNDESSWGTNCEWVTLSAPPQTDVIHLSSVGR